MYLPARHLVSWFGLGVILHQKGVHVHDISYFLDVWSLFVWKYVWSGLIINIFVLVLFLCLLFLFCWLSIWRSRWWGPELCWWFWQDRKFCKLAISCDRILRAGSTLVLIFSLYDRMLKMRSIHPRRHIPQFRLLQIKEAMELKSEGLYVKDHLRY